VRTITRIVSVVPVAVRVVIAALVALILALAARSRLAGVRAGRLEAQRRQLQEDVGLLQTALLPAPPDHVGPVLTSVAYRPADGPGAGGDFYDLFAREDGRLAVIVGDLSGHGREALPQTALVRFTLRTYLEAGLSPRSALQAASAVIERQLGRQFATVVVATYDPRDGTLVYANAGHPPPIVIGPEPFTPITVCSPPPIGFGWATGTRQTTLSLPGRSTVCFYTDGVVEASVEGGLFGADRLQDILAELGDASASTLLDRVAEASERRPDDMAACVLRVEGHAGGAGSRVEELELDAPAAASESVLQFLDACGVGAGRATEVLHSASLTAERAGGVILRVRFGDGEPRAQLYPRNAAALHSSVTAAPAP
jgi:hypothetical protein